jgi:hypothetical protein
MPASESQKVLDSVLVLRLSMVTEIDNTSIKFYNSALKQTAANSFHILLD